MLHVLKTDHQVFQYTLLGLQTFQIREDDRNFIPGDELHLKETRYTGQEMAYGAHLEYTGNETFVRITHIMRGPIYGLDEGWVIISVKPSDRRV
jgi:hypothetical protein